MWCPTLCNSVDCSLPGSSVCGISQARILESESCSVVSDSLGPYALYSPWNFPGQNIGLGSLSRLQGIFPIQESNQGHLYCKWILYQLSYQGCPTLVFAGVACDFLLQGIFPTQGLNPHLLHCMGILYYLSHQRSQIWKSLLYLYLDIELIIAPSSPANCPVGIHTSLTQCWRNLILLLVRPRTSGQTVLLLSVE